MTTETKTKLDELRDRLQRVAAWHGVSDPMVVWRYNGNGICEVFCESQELIEPIHIVSHTQDNLVQAFDAVLRAQLVPGRVEE